MSWFWLNIPLGVVFFLAVSGIPLWLVLKHPDAPAPETPKPVPVRRHVAVTGVSPTAPRESEIGADSGAEQGVLTGAVL